MCVCVSVCLSVRTSLHQEANGVHVPGASCLHQWCPPSLAGVLQVRAVPQEEVRHLGAGQEVGAGQEMGEGQKVVKDGAVITYVLTRVLTTVLLQ